MDSTSRRAQPGATSADNGELVPETPEDVEDALRDAEDQQTRVRPATDALGMRSTSASTEP